MANSQQVVPQGNLNRIIASIVFDDHPELNVTPPFLGRGAISISFDSDYTTTIETMTGLVQSPEPFILSTLTINLLRTQNLAQLYQQQTANSTIIGNATVRPDVAQNQNGIQPFELQNLAIKSIREMSFAGADPAFMVTLHGYISINSSLWS